MNHKWIQCSVAVILAGMVGLFIGGVVIYYLLVPPLARNLDLTREYAEGQEAYVYYRYGAYPVAKAALIEFADTTPRPFDKGLTYGRIAIAAEREEEWQDAARYMELAIQAFTERNNEQTDEVQVRSFVERLDSAFDRRMSGVEKIEE